MKESDLYLPLKAYLEGQGYEVKGEVQDCDVLAIREDEAPVIVELKLSLNLTVILQAVDRLALSSKVYIGVPANCTYLKHKKRKAVVKLLRMLGLGLILIDSKRETFAVEILLDPSEYKPRKSKYKQERLLGEFEKRVGDPNLGGASTRRGRMTAYRQRAIVLAIYLQKHGEHKASVLAKELKEPKARNILYDNVYGWFERLGGGVYKLSPRGAEEIPLWRKY